jgi:16S rRNA pseudouridine516 synthase
MRLDKLLTHLGVASRSGVKELLKAGRVRVNGEAVRDAAFQVQEGDGVLLDGKRLDTRLSRHVMLHKPAGVLTAKEDARQKTVMDLLPPVYSALGCMPVGRLDKDTTGLLFFTTDGALAHRLLSPERHVDKVYLAEVDGPLTEKDVEAFAAGLAMGDFTALPARLEILESGAGRAAARVTVREGKFHQIKRMFEAVGRTVTALHRERFGPLELGGLPPGAWREATEEELDSLRGAVGMPRGREDNE